VSRPDAEADPFGPWQAVAQRNRTDGSSPKTRAEPNELARKLHER
jgi:hypothetical protein